LHREAPGMGRSRAVLAGSLMAALVIAMTLLWAANAQSKPKPKPVPQGGIAAVQLLGVNDFHGNLEPTIRRDQPGKALGGAAYLDAYLDRYEAQNPERTIRVHAGDMVGASPLISSYFHDEPTIYATNEMGFDVGTLGNHEFDEGGEEMLRLINGGQRDDGLQFKDGVDGEPVNTSDPDYAGAAYPYVAANTVYKDSGQTVLPPYKIVKKDGINVGFIGVTTLETPRIVLPDAVAPFDYPDISDTVNKYAKELQAQGVQSIVVLAHAGGMYQSAKVATGEIIDETQQMSRAVDVVIAGHSHSFLNNRVDGKLVVEAYSFGTAFDKVDLRINRDTGDVIKSSAEVIDTDNAGVAPDPATAALVKEYKDRITPISERVVGEAAETITRTNNAAGESPLGQLIADAQREYAGTQIAFMNPGGIRADIQAGPVTYGEIFAVQPFDNQVAKMDLTGDQIYRLLEQQFPPAQTSGNRILQVSGMRFSYDSTQPAGERIREVKVVAEDGITTDLDRTATYTVAANSFLATGGDGFTVFKEGQNVQTVGGDLDALEAHFERLSQSGPVEAPDPSTNPRITKLG
jgi:5'-nucleotidase